MSVTTARFSSVFLVLSKLMRRSSPVACDVVGSAAVGRRDADQAAQVVDEALRVSKLGPAGIVRHCSIPHRFRCRSHVSTRVRNDSGATLIQNLSQYGKSACFPHWEMLISGYENYRQEPADRFLDEAPHDGSLVEALA